MCFTAEASFVAGTVLLITGAASIKKVTEKKQLMFAAIPLVFATQQFSEGFLWISLHDPAHANWHMPFTYTFLIFAQVVWPSWVPIAFFLTEKDKKRRKILFVITCLGVLLSLYLLYCILIYKADSIVTNYHIFYKVEYPDLNGYGSVIYFIVAVIPPFISKIKWAWILGTLDLSSFLISKLLFKDNVLSVWCFIAAIISILVYFMMKEINKKEKRFSASTI